MPGVPGNVSNRPDSRPLAFAYPARPQKSDFQVFSFRQPSMSDAITALLLEPSETGPGCASPARSDPLSGVPGVSIPLSSASTPSPPRPDGRSSDKSRSPRGRNPLCNFRNAEVTAPILGLLDRVSSVLAQSGRPSRKGNRKSLKALHPICVITDCICDC